jgi:hypothetical protein
MADPTRTRKARLIIANSIACATLLMLIAAPRPVSSAVLGNGWQCSTTAFVLTTCRPTSHFEE